MSALHFDSVRSFLTCNHRLQMKRVAIVASGLGFGLMATDGWFHVPEDHAGILFSSVVGVIPRSFESGYHLKTPVVAKNIANIFLGSDEK